MSLTRFSLASYAVIALGVLLGIFGIVRGGSILIACGCAAMALSQKNERAIGRFLPLALAIALFALAIALPRGR
ncbi:MAG: hypothetical protein D4R83_06050 [Streptomycetaceae bacterium]|nr:MAG: hypothetical protein D4R83_06050 [Streptomycetaceae bacterium]